MVEFFSLILSPLVYLSNPSALLQLCGSFWFTTLFLHHWPELTLIYSSPIFLLCFIMLFSQKCCFKLTLEVSFLARRMPQSRFLQNFGTDVASGVGEGVSRRLHCLRYADVHSERLRRHWLEMGKLKTSTIQTLRDLHSKEGIYWPKKQENNFFQELAVYIVLCVYPAIVWLCKDHFFQQSISVPAVFKSSQLELWVFSVTFPQLYIYHGSGSQHLLTSYCTLRTGIYLRSHAKWSSLIIIFFW